MSPWQLQLFVVLAYYGSVCICKYTEKQTASHIAEPSDQAIYVLEDLRHTYGGSAQGLMWYDGWREGHKGYDSKKV